MFQSGADGILSGRFKTSAAASVKEHRANMLGVICRNIKEKLKTAQIIFTCNTKNKYKPSHKNIIDCLFRTRLLVSESQY